MKVSSGVLGFGLLVASVLSVARTSDGAPSAVQTPAPIPAASAPAGDPVAGKESFTTYCSVCHGVGAKGFIGPSIAGVNWTAPGLRTIVRGGLGGYGGMPAFNADAVTDTNITDIAAYLATLPPAVAPPAATSVASALPSTSSSPVAGVAASGDPIHGKQIYAANCAACHGATGQGGIGPNLHGEKARKDTAAAIAWIKNPVLPMPKLYPSPLSEKDVEDVAAFVESL